MYRKIITVTVEYADFGGQENFVTTEQVLAEDFDEARKKLARHFKGADFHIISYCWNRSVIDSPRGGWLGEFITLYRNRIPRKRTFVRRIDYGVALCTPHFDIALRWKYQMP